MKTTKEELVEVINQTLLNQKYGENFTERLADAILALDKPQGVSEIIKNIYDCEIPCRIEWIYDQGFTWSIQNDDYPRLWIDDNLAGTLTVINETDESLLMRNNPLLEKDWIVRGCADTFSEAVNELSDAIRKSFPYCSYSVNYLKN